MDANGTRFHLLDGEQDWDPILKRKAGSVSASPGGLPDVDWDGNLGAVTLRPQMPIFPRGRRALPLDPTRRSGAACDRFGTWYWIGIDRQSLFRAPAGSRRAVIFWRPAGSPPSTRKGEFSPPKPPESPSFLLGGLAVTSRHYLVAGCFWPTDSRGGLLLFDLHAGGEPLRLDFPGAFEPFDLVAAADPGTNNSGISELGNPGGVWVLDRRGRRLWGLDRLFRLLPLAPPPAPMAPEPGSFNGSAGGSPPAPFLDLAAGNPIAVESLPDGSLLVLDEPETPGSSSRLFHYRPGPVPGALIPPAAPLTLPGLDQVAAPDALMSRGTPLPPRAVRAYDLAYLPGFGPSVEGGHSPEPPYLAVVEQDGNQAIAYRLALPQLPAETLSAEPLAIYLPMHYFGGRSLAFGQMPGSDPETGERGLFYDVALTDGPAGTHDLSVRWVRLHSLDQPRYLRQGSVETPIFDSRQVGCTWHRLFLDACIPPETQVKVFTRAGDDYDLLAAQIYQPEPDPYLRGRGPEIPYWDSGLGKWASRGPVGTWETAFQAAAGRFLQVRLEMAGNGRSSPAVSRLRAYYPRFSYLRSYLPAAYAAEPESASFTERFLANMEGFYTDLEGKIAAAALLFDPRGAPPESLDWLAAWVGLVLDPLWAELGSDRSLDRRRLLIRFAMRLYERRGTPDGIRFAMTLLLDPCLESTLRRFDHATVVPDLALRQELERMGLPYPSLKEGEAALEELLYRYVLHAPGRSRVRIVESWETRPLTAGGESDAGSIDDQPDDASVAHHFSVLIPEDLPAGYTDMVKKIVGMEKPAHTDFDLRRFWDYFLVGQARLGLDTVLGEEARFLPILLGRDYLAEGYLESAPPMDTPERSISDRDRPGGMVL